MNKNIFEDIRFWLPNFSDIPEAIRIALPIVISFLVFTSFGNSSCGVNAMVCAFLVGVQGRNLAYPKRASLLTKSAILCCVSGAVPLLANTSIYIYLAILAVACLLYGLTSNQRRYIQLFAYNSGFCMICSYHLVDSGYDWQLIVLSSIVGSFSAVICSVIAGPWLAVKQGNQLFDVCKQHLIEWCAVIADPTMENISKRLASREKLNESVCNLSHWLLEMPNSVGVDGIALKLQRLLDIIVLMETLARVNQTNPRIEKSVDLKEFFTKFSEELKAFDFSSVNSQLETPELPSVPREFAFSQLLDDSQQSLNELFTVEPSLRSNWRDTLSLLWPSDSENIKIQWKKAIKPHSREWHHGFRILFSMVISQFVVNLLDLPQGQWVILTTYIVLMVAPLGQLQTRLWNRFYGTILSSSIALLLIMFLGQGTWLYPALCVTVFFSFGTFQKANYEIHVFWITMMMVFTVSLLLPSEPYIALYRIMDTLAGVLIAFLAMHLIFPSWTYRWIDSYLENWWDLELKWINELSKGNFDSNYRWLAHAALRQLNNEITIMSMEPNITKKEESDWHALLWNGVALHTSLVVLETKKLPLSNLEVNQFKNWLSLYQERFSTKWSLLPDNEEELLNSNPHSWLSHDIAKLYSWLNWKRPFALK